MHIELTLANLVLRIRLEATALRVSNSLTDLFCI